MRRHDPDQAVEVTIDHSGTLIDVRASARVLQQSPEHTAAAMLRPYQRAKRELAVAAAEIVKETIGTDTATGKALLDGFKTPEPEEQQL
jgi:hypothetical protein